MNRSVWYVCLISLALAACSSDLLGRDVEAQAHRGGDIAFDVVKIDESVLDTLLAQPRPAFAERFKKNVPPPELKIAVGDMVSVVIWESAGNGLFGNSLTELSFEAGATSRLRTGQTLTPSSLLSLPSGVSTSAGTLSQLLGLSPTPGTAAAGDQQQQQQVPLGGALAGIANQQQTAAAAGSQAISGFGGQPGGSATGQQQPGASVAGQQLSGLARGADSQRLEELASVATQGGRPGTRIPDQQVGTDGAISIPYAGRVEVADRTPSDVQHRIEELLGPKALDPQVLVVVKRSAANAVSVAGVVIGGARVPLSPGDRLLQVIAAVGGARAPMSETYVRLSRGGLTATVPLATLVANPEQNIFAEPGDVLTLVRRPKTYTVFGATGVGAVGQNSAISFLSERLSLAEALARTGGLLDERADARAIFLLRYEPVELVRALGQPVATGATEGGSPIAYRLDLKEAKSYLLARRFPVHDKDIIFVANAEIQPVFRAFRALSQIVGPVETALITCQTAKSC